MSYDWDEYENEKADIMRSEDPAYIAACEEESENIKELYELGEFLMDLGSRLQVACDEADTDKMETIIGDLGDIDLPTISSIIDEIKRIQMNKAGF